MVEYGAFSQQDGTNGRIWTGRNFELPAGRARLALPIAQNSALFSLLGTQYGGDGRTTFALPDLRGRTAIGAGQGPGLTARRQGERGGTEYESTGPALAVDSERGVPGSAPAGSNMPPYLALRQCIVTQGIFPSRN